MTLPATSGNPLLDVGAGLASGVLSGLGGGSAGPAVSGTKGIGDVSSTIHIAPQGLNLGEILKGYEGPTQNGGAEASRAFLPAFSQSADGTSLSFQAPGASVGGVPITYIALGGVGLLATFLLLRKVR